MLFTQVGEGAPFLEVLQYQVDAWSGRSKPLFHLPVPKINLIYGPWLRNVSVVKLKRTGFFSYFIGTQSYLHLQTLNTRFTYKPQIYKDIKYMKSAKLLKCIYIICVCIIYTYIHTHTLSLLLASEINKLNLMH